MPDDNQAVGEVNETIETPEVETEATETLEVVAVEPEKPKDDDDAPIPKGVQKRIDRAIRRQYEAEAEAKYLREQVNQIQQQRQPVPQVQEAAEPKLENFQDYETYLDAKAEFIAERKIQQTFALQNQRNAMERAQAAQKQTVESWQQKVSSVTAELPDFADVVGSSNVPMPDHMKAVVMQSEQGPKLAYYLASHPDEAEQIASQHPLAAIRSLMRIEDKLDAAKTAKKTTDAPAPITPSGAKAKSEKSPDQMTDREFAEWRKSQIAKRR